MLNVIVPLDFSQTSFNAAHYAANMFKNRPDIRMILYHFYTRGEDTTTARNYLNSQKQEFSGLVTNIEIQLESGNNFIDCLAAFAHVKGALMIVMGLTGKTPREQRFSGSNTLKLSEKEICPVLIVPDDAVYKGISNALITTELRAVEETPTLLAVKRVLHIFDKPSLHILNINPSHYIALTEDFKKERDKMEVILSEFNPEFYFMRLYDFHESVDVFSRDKNIDLIIIAPRYHNFYARLFKTQHTKKLIYQSKVPVLTIHE
ncbi:MAG: universal stress protein [Ferruginibacter sp.]|nr:universal stress protein [Ferruginibacter sp.]